MRVSLFDSSGVHCVVDGQFGSTGKGALCSWLAKQAAVHRKQFNGAIYSGGPNSGHTFYAGNVKHVLKQLPTFSVATTLLGGHCPAYLSAGSVIDPEILFQEAHRYPTLQIYVHPCAAIVDNDARDFEDTSGAREIASTMSGTGGALMRKIARKRDAVWGGNVFPDKPKNITTLNHNYHVEDELYFMEVAQGFSLGINSEFYPHVTSRECTVMQGLADARIAPRHLARTYMSIRTFPIRVGNVPEGHSGGWYGDQEEARWEDIGVEPELTTVTKRKRRIATFSYYQFEDAIIANDPDFVFINFLNYIQKKEDQDAFIRNISQIRDSNGKWFDLIGGYGPTPKDIRPI